MSSILKNREAVSAAIEKSGSAKEVLERLGLRAAGGNYKSLSLACAEMELKLPQFDRTAQLRGVPKLTRIPNELVFVENSTYHNRTSIKQRMFELGVPNVCNKCQQEPFWNGMPLVLNLEHKNGVWNDNRLENLEILCGHCHSQTSTFAGRGGKGKRQNRSPWDKRLESKQYFCNTCGKERTSNSVSGLCGDCSRKALSKVNYPITEELVSSVLSVGYVKTAQPLGITDKGLRKHLAKFLPPEHPIFNKQKKRK